MAQLIGLSDYVYLYAHLVTLRNSEASAALFGPTMTSLPFAPNVPVQVARGLMVMLVGRRNVGNPALAYIRNEATALLLLIWIPPLLVWANIVAMELLLVRLRLAYVLLNGRLASRALLCRLHPALLIGLALAGTRPLLMAIRA